MSQGTWTCDLVRPQGLGQPQVWSTWSWGYCLVISDLIFPTLQPEEAERVKAQAQTLGLAEAQPMAVVQSVPGAHPVPVYAFSIKGPSYGEVRFSPAPASPSEGLDSTRKVSWHWGGNPGLYQISSSWERFCSAPSLCSPLFLAAWSGSSRKAWPTPSPAGVLRHPGLSEASRDWWTADSTSLGRLPV